MSEISLAAQHYQLQVRSVVPERFRLPRIFTALALVEELGEFVSDAIQSQGDRDAGGLITDEIGDLLFSCAEIANEYNFPLLPDGVALNTASGQLLVQIAELTVLVGRIAKSMLELECFDRDTASKLLASSTQDTTMALFGILSARGLRSQKILQSSLDKMQKRIESGKWESLYGDLLLKKRIKHD